MKPLLILLPKQHDGVGGMRLAPARAPRFEEIGGSASARHFDANPHRLSRLFRQPKQHDSVGGMRLAPVQKKYQHQAICQFERSRFVLKGLAAVRQLVTKMKASPLLLQLQIVKLSQPNPQHIHGANSQVLNR